MSTEIPQNAISIYQQDNGMDDFPILKAFQQYIDAEQSKARKRMVLLCIFFGALITILIAVFMFLMREINLRNQQLNDRLVEYAMKDHYQSPAAAQQPQIIVPDNSANEAAMRAMTDTLISLQKQIAEQQRQQPQVVAPAVSPAPDMAPLSVEELALDRKTRAAEEKLKKARSLLDAEKKKLAEEREQLRQEKIEQQRRRLYPEYYAEKATPSAQPAVAKKQLSDDDIAEILREVDAHLSLENTENDEILDDDLDDAIEYFNDDEYEIPVEVKGTSTKWHVPLD